MNLVDFEWYTDLDSAEEVSYLSGVKKTLLFTELLKTYWQLRSSAETVMNPDYWQEYR